MASSSTLLKLTPLHQWTPTFSYTHHRSAHYCFFCKPQRKPNLLIRLQISCEHKQRNTDAKSDSLAALFPDCDLAVSGGRIGGSAFLSSPSSSSYSFSSSSSSSWWSSFLSSSSSSSWWSSFLSLKFFFSSGWMVAIFLALSVVLVVSVLIFWVLSVVIKFLKDRYEDSRSNQKISVVKLQVGLLGSGTIQQDFDRLGENADTSTKEGLGNVLTEATLDLLRHPDYCMSCYSSVDVTQSEEEGEDRFNRLSIDERRKFEETLVNVNSIKRKSSKIQRASGFSNEYIVVTILVAAKGTIQKLQPINEIADLKEALLTLGSIRTSRIMAVEILWTPKDKKESLSERKLLKDYPALKPF